MMPRAAIYVRVSSEEQVSNLSLDVQERACREFCARQGLEVSAVYREEGESARTAERTELTRMLRELRLARGTVQHLVVYDLSRFARDQFVHLTLKRALASLGVTLRSATQPIADDENGRLLEGMLSVMNQWENEMRAKKIREGMRETARRGRWAHRAPIGYLNGRATDGSKSIELDPARAELVRVLFGLLADGLGILAVRDRLKELGLRSWRGRILDCQDIRRIASSPFYVGTVRSLGNGIETIGGHPPLVARATWLRAQAALSKGPAGAARATVPEDDFPLRGLALCASCGRPLTASWSRGKLGKRYGYYYCFQRGCRATKVRRETLEERFLELLGRIRLQPEQARLLELVIRDVWSEAAETGEREAAATKRALENLRGRKERLLEAYVYERAIDAETYRAQLAGLDSLRAKLELELHDARIEKLQLETELELARPFLTAPERLWREFDAAGKRRLQTLIFPAGIETASEAVRTPSTALVFNLLPATEREKMKMVEQKGFEPSTPTLRTWCSPS